MCVFTYKNTSSGKALAKGVEYFECGSCPECLQKKSRKWALRAGMEAKVSPGVMVTLTYDTYKVVEGKITSEENPVDTSLSVNKKHCQDFIKRLRKHFRDRRIKYLLTAEYGKRTGRAHYHALLFNVVFDDLIKYKKSKRNNIIYKSKTLEKIWKHGICTVDCINLTAKTARYCTKYCAKDSGVDDTFMLFSRGIGDEKLMELFNGRSYWIDGREYSIPREIWQKYIENKYKIPGFSRYIGVEHLETMEKRVCGQLDYEFKKQFIIDTKVNLWRLKFNAARRKKQRKMVNFCRRMQYKYRKIKSILRKNTQKQCEFIVDNFENSSLKYYAQAEKRDIYTIIRDSDPLYKSYIEYWKNKNEVCNLTRPSEIERISMLPDLKYWSYKQKALRAKILQFTKKSFVPPRSNCQRFLKPEERIIKVYEEKSFAPLSRHYTANDTEHVQKHALFKRIRRLEYAVMRANAKRCEFTPFYNPLL